MLGCQDGQRKQRKISMADVCLSVLSAIECMLRSIRHISFREDSRSSVHRGRGESTRK